MLYLLLGWQFVVAQFVGGVVMIALLSFATHYVFSQRYQNVLHERVLRDSPPVMTDRGKSWRERDP